MNTKKKKAGKQNTLADQQSGVKMTIAPTNLRREGEQKLRRPRDLGQDHSQQSGGKEYGEKGGGLFGRVLGQGPRPGRRGAAGRRKKETSGVKGVTPKGKGSTLFRF